MCGFTGFLTLRSEESPLACEHLLREMADTIRHRGPDSDGYWVDVEAGIGLAHRRLAIIDMSPAGAQPMASVSGRYVIAFNGEIYNHLRLRDQLERGDKLPSVWRGHSDTETLLAAFEAWGIEETLQRTIGMFAIAVWDRTNGFLTLARDRFGEKPLYFGWQGSGNQLCFLFGSELSALRKHPAFNSEINRDALSQYMRHNYIGGGHSIYDGIYKLEPGHLLTVSLSKTNPVIRPWWDSLDTASCFTQKPFLGSADQAVDALEDLLCDSVSQQMVSDVPLGAFLSGGIDSSTVVALMQANSSMPVRTFSIGFYEQGYNEAEHAKAVAMHLGTNHTEMYVTPEQAIAVIPKLPTLYSEPFADSSQIPTFLVSQLARQHVTVTLSGDAGDELFCGYTRYQLTGNLWGKLSRLPLPLRKILGSTITSAPPAALDALGKYLPYSRLGEKLHKGAGLMGSRSVEDLYRGMVSHWHDPTNLVLGATEPASQISSTINALRNLNDVERMMALDMISYLPDDILVKVDRAAMGVGLETRVPFLDHRVFEFSWSLPLNYKLRDGVTKWPLRQVLYRYVPRELVERPKMGFGVPIGEWLKGSLRDWAETLLNESRLRQEGYLNPAPIRQKWTEHISGRRNWESQLWGVLMFQAWLESQNGK